MANGITGARSHAGIRWYEGLVTVPRSRGVSTGLIIMILGIWAAIIPFVGPYFNYAFLNDSTWFFDTNRLYFNILPGAAAFFGGLFLIFSANRPAMHFGSWLALAGGIWLVVGLTISGLWAALPGIGPALGDSTRVSLEYLGYYYGTGAIITALSGIALGRLSVRSLRDVKETQKDRP